LDEFSVPPQVIPELKFIIRTIGFKAVQGLAKEAMVLSTGTQVEEFAKTRLEEILR
jgi:phosphoenolpyruvate-protein kinase (PTS system EI component)